MENNKKGERERERERETRERLVSALLKSTEIQLRNTNAGGAGWMEDFVIDVALNSCKSCDGCK